MRRPGRRDLPLLVLVLAAVVLVGVVVLRDTGREDPFEDYCAAVVDHRSELGAALTTGKQQTGLLRALPAFEDLADKSPEDIRADWRIVVERVSGLRDALAEAGVDPESYDAAKPPEGLDPAQVRAIQTAATRLAAADMATALGRVQQQARDVCKTPLSL
ncbi:hypothetical protein [Nocardioides sp. LML1-1-1.1]|uniref:hypothetical protein n=1 Tax=Nocardioides sp. LML1-1-1.1 TaxID=3135248 RepID=UPI0034472584